jgi:signal transduction histidine kinase/ligand-binding sensor domain-containing protein
MRAIVLAAVANLGFAAAASEYLIQSWEINQGLPQVSVLAIAQTRDRYLWVGTFGGLARFDGLTFTNFDSGTTPGLPSNRIVGLCEDSRGSLWVGTGEAGVAEYRDGVFRAYAEKDGLPSNKVRAMVADGAGDVWIATWKGLMRRRGGRFELFPSETDVLSLAEGRDGSILAGTSTGVSEFRAAQFGRSFDAGEPVLAIHQDRRGTVWFGTNQRLYRLEGGRKLAAPVTGEVRQILEDHTGALWVGTSVGLWNRVNGDWHRYDTGDGLSENFVRSLAEDSEGNIWAGTNGRGLNRLKRGTVTVIGSGVGLATENTVPVLEDREGAIWFGLNCGGLVRYAQGAYRVYTEKDGLGSDCVWSLWQDREGTLWAGTRHGITRIRDGKLQTYTRENSSLSDNWVTTIYEDRGGALWIGTGNGVNRLEAGAFRAYHQSDGLADDDVRFITEDPQGALWFGTTGGMSRLEGGHFTTYTKSNGLPHDFVRAIHFDHAGTMWIGTYGGGLARLRDGRFTYFNTTNGLAENIVSRILEDNQGNLWLSGNHGIHRVNIRELEDGRKGGAYAVLSYDTSDGMKSAECNGGGSPAGWKGRDGRLWFPTQRGVVGIAPASITASAPAPAVWIEQALVDRKPTGLTGEIRIPPGGSDLEIHYTALSFSAPEKVRFQYRLEGLKDGWVDAGARRTAYYTHLPPRHYRFSVIAANGDGVWNRKGAALGVTVVPALWQTWWFRLLWILTLTGAAAYVYRRRIQAVERATAQQAAYSGQLIASQENERQRIAAELHDSLGQTLSIIKNRAMMSLNEPENHQRALEQMDEIAEAAAHALHEVREIAYDLRPFQLDRLGLRASIEIMAAKAAAAAEVRFRTEVEDLDGLLSPEERIHAYRIVQEAVNNVLKHSGASEASVRVKRVAAGIEIAVSDDGKGFAFEGNGSTGFGLHGMGERARILGGKLSVDSAPGRGTMVHVLISRGA